MHPILKEKIVEIYGDSIEAEHNKVIQLFYAVNEIIMNLEYEVCINKKLATHFLNEYRLINNVLTQSNLRCLELEAMNAKLQQNCTIYSI